MYKNYNINSLQQPYYTQNSDERFIWPLIPFLGGAAIGYIAGRPQYNYYPSYYPIYYPYYPTYYYNRPIISSSSYGTNNSL